MKPGKGPATAGGGLKEEGRGIETRSASPNFRVLQRRRRNLVERESPKRTGLRENLAVRRRRTKRSRKLLNRRRSRRSTRRSGSRKSLAQAAWATESRLRNRNHPRSRRSPKANRKARRRTRVSRRSSPVRHHRTKAVALRAALQNQLVETR